MSGLGSRTTGSDAFDVDRVLVAFTLPHKGHDGVPGVPDDSCLRCNAERAFDRIVAARVRAEEALQAAKENRVAAWRKDIERLAAARDALLACGVESDEAIALLAEQGRRIRGGR